MKKHIQEGFLSNANADSTPGKPIESKLAEDLATSLSASPYVRFEQRGTTLYIYSKSKNTFLRPAKRFAMILAANKFDCVTLAPGVDIVTTAFFLSGYRIFAPDSKFTLWVGGTMDHMDITAKTIRFATQNDHRARPIKKIEWIDCKLSADTIAFAIPGTPIEMIRTRNTQWVCDNALGTFHISVSEAAYAKEFFDAFKGEKRTDFLIDVWGTDDTHGSLDGVPEEFPEVFADRKWKVMDAFAISEFERLCESRIAHNMLVEAAKLPDVVFADVRGNRIPIAKRERGIAPKLGRKWNDSPFISIVADPGRPIYINSDIRIECDLTSELVVDAGWYTVTSTSGGEYNGQMTAQMDDVALVFDSNAHIGPKTTFKDKFALVYFDDATKDTIANVLKSINVEHVYYVGKSAECAAEVLKYRKDARVYCELSKDSAMLNYGCVQGKSSNPTAMDSVVKKVSGANLAVLKNVDLPARPPKPEYPHKEQDTRIEAREEVVNLSSESENAWGNVSIYLTNEGVRAFNMSGMSHPTTIYAKSNISYFPVAQLTPVTLVATHASIHRGIYAPLTVRAASVELCSIGGNLKKIKFDPPYKELNVVIRDSRFAAEDIEAQLRKMIPSNVELNVTRKDNSF